MRLMIRGRSAAAETKEKTASSHGRWVETMNKKEQKLQREHQEDVILNKVLCWIVGSVVLEFLLLLLNRYYVNYTAAPESIALAGALRTAFKVLGVALPICAVAAAAWYLSLRKKGSSKPVHGILALVLAVLAVCALVVALFGDSGIQLLYTAMPGVAVLALIYYLYQREFFVSALLSAMGLLGVHLIPRTGISAAVAYGYAVLVAVVLVAALVLGRKLQTSKGVLDIQGRQVEVFPKNANYTMLYVTCGVVAVVLAAAFVVGSVALLYGVLVAWLLIMAVYYTVRLM